MSRFLRLGLPLVLLAAAASLVGFRFLSSWRGGGLVPEAEVVRGDFVHRVEAEGVLKAEQATVLMAPSSIRTDSLKIAWIAEDGSTLEVGDLIVRFDATDMERELFEGEAERNQALNKRTKKEVEEGVALENLRRDAELADLQLEYARRFQPKDEEIFSRTEIIESEIDETLATKRKDHAAEIQSIRGELGQVDLDLLELERRRAELTIDRAEAGLRDLEIRAPHAGILVLTRDDGELPMVGSVVYRRRPIAEIPQLDVMKANVFVLEADAGGVRPGIPAEVFLEAHPDEVYPARVRTVASVAQRRSRYSPVQYFEVELELDHTDPTKMKPGQRLRATLFLQNLEDALSIPREAVFEGADGAWVVYRRSGRGFDAVEVELGPAALGRVVVEAGLSEGDIIALVDPTHRVAETEEEEAGASGTLQSPGSQR